MTYIVTGVSRGLGEAITRLLLNEGKHVIGIGRSHHFTNVNFSFCEVDLGQLKDIKQLDFDVPKGPITLINNAGILGNVKRISDQQNPDLEDVLQVNTIAPTILNQYIYKRVSDKNAYSLVNISSGAANRAIPSWAAYCTSKAALNMMTECFYLEEKEKGNRPKVFAVAPGVIDTDMQTLIRNSGEDNFSAVQNFIDMKNDKILFSSEYAAQKLLELLSRPFGGNITYDLREV